MCPPFFFGITSKKGGLEVQNLAPKKAGWALFGPIWLFFFFLFLAAPVLKKIPRPPFLSRGLFPALPLERCFDCRNLSLKIDYPSLLRRKLLSTSLTLYQLELRHLRGSSLPCWSFTERKLLSPELSMVAELSSWWVLCAPRSFL